MKKLIICEKPSLAMNVVNAIGNMNRKDGFFEGENYVVTFAFGHLLTLYDVDDYKNRDKTSWNLDDLPFIPDKFLFKIKDDKGIKKQFKIIESLVVRNDIEEIINCGDADREGEVIINNIIFTIFKKEKITKPVKRLWLPEQTPQTIRKQLQQCNDISKTANLMNEGLARTYIDWLYGINLTRFLTLKAHTLLPVGRVLIPTVKYIYDRDMEIDNFIPKKYLEIDVSIIKGNKEQKLTFPDLKFDDASDLSRLSADDLLQRLKEDHIVVKNIERKEKIKQRPKLFSLDTLQNLLSKNYKYSLSESLKIIQSLYEKGYVTYPRTNTEYLSENEKDKVKELLTSLHNDDLTFFDKKSIFDDSKIESHSAIIITQKLSGIDNLSEKEKNVYNTIKNRFYSVFCKDDAILEENSIIFSFESNKYESKLKGTSILQKGFLKYEPMKENLLPVFREGEEFIPKLSLEEKETTPPSKVTEIELNNFFKNPFKKENPNISDEEEYKDILSGLEIGTVATRASIIDNAIHYGYIEKKGNSFSITKKGKFLIGSLDKLKIDMSKEKTVEVSKNLKDVYLSKQTVDDVVETVDRELEQEIKKDSTIDFYVEAKEIIGKCPKCGKNVLENSKSFYCEDYKNCNFSIFKKNKYFEKIGLKKFTKKDMQKLLKDGFFEAKNLTSKSGKNYNAKLYLKLDGKYTSFEMKFD